MTAWTPRALKLTTFGTDTEGFDTEGVDTEGLTLRAVTLRALYWWLLTDIDIKDDP